MLRTHAEHKRPPQDVLMDPDVWCEGCLRFVRASGCEGGLCWECRGVDEPPEFRPITKAELDAEIRVDFSLSANWTITRSQWHGSEDEWRDLVRALRGDFDYDPKKADEIIQEAAERFDAMDAESHSSFGPDVDLRLRKAS